MKSFCEIFVTPIGGYRVILDFIGIISKNMELLYCHRKGYYTSIVENQMGKKMEHEMETQVNVFNAKTLQVPLIGVVGS